MTRPGRDGSLRAGAVGAVLAVFTALLITVVAFLVPFNALGGSLGGFDDEDFDAVLSPVDLVMDGEQPLRDFTENQLRNAWPSLNYELPALAQRVWGRNLLVYAALTVGSLALCAGAVFLLSLRMSSSWILASLSAALLIVSVPRAYNYPKLLVLTATGALIWWAESRSGILRLGLLAALTVIGFLFRHDLGIYVATGAGVLLLTSEPVALRSIAIRMAGYGALTCVLLLPSLIWIEQYGGLARYIGGIVDTTQNELTTRHLSSWPRISLSHPFVRQSLLALEYYAFWALPLAAAGVAAVRLVLTPRRAQLPDLGCGLALAVVAALANHYFLRTNLEARLGDAVVPVAILGAWIAGHAGVTQVGRTIATRSMIALFGIMTATFVGIFPLGRQLDEAGLTTSPSAVMGRFARVRAELAGLPPRAWAERPREGAMAAASYLHECTGPGDRVLLATSAGEIPYFASRRFAAGQSAFEGGFQKSDTNQRQALERLTGQSVPVAITEFELDDFSETYPLVAEYVRDHYREVGLIPRDGVPSWRVFAKVGVEPRRTDPVLGFPCFR